MITNFTLFNFLQNIPQRCDEEIFQTILENKNIKIERIVSYGQNLQKKNNVRV